MEFFEATAQDDINIGACILIYGAMAAGKTRSALTLPDPILHINTEPKDPRTVHGVTHGKAMELL